MACECSDVPFCSALMAKTLIMVREKEGLKWGEYYLRFEEGEEEDEFSLMQTVFEKAYHYCQEKEILEFVEGKGPVSKLL